MVGQEPLVRIRQKHSRSRTGCIICRQRHIRCDEQRPCCANCTDASKVCEYAALGQTLRIIATKTRFPGVEAPWQITPQVSVSVADPFDALPIKMPFQSTDLIRLFMQTKAPIGNIVPSATWKENISAGNAEASFCRGMVLISSAYFAGHASNLRQFESAYLHHKIETMREINGWLSRPETQMKIQCLNLISTLLLTEAYLGNYTVAEHHFLGLKKVIDLRGQLHSSGNIDHEEQSEEEAELEERFNLLAQAMTKSISTRGKSSSAQTPRSLPPSQAKPLLEPDLAEAFRLTPYFFSSAQAEVSRMVDGTKTIDELRYLVSLLDPCLDTTAQKFPANPSARDMAVMILQFNQVHAASIFGLHRDISESNVVDELICSWGDLVAARHCFCYGVLGIKKIGIPAEKKLVLYFSTLLLDNVELNTSALLLAQCNPDLWIWKVFSAALALSRFWSTLIELHGPQYIQQIQRSVNSHMEYWRWVQGVEHWYQVENALKRIVWPEEEVEDARAIWEAAVDSSCSRSDQAKLC